MIFPALKKLRGKRSQEYIEIEMEELAAEKSLKVSQNAVSFSDLFKNPMLRKPLILTIVIQASQVTYFLHNL